MTHEELENEFFYHQSVQILNKMLEKRLITEEEYKKIDLLNRKSFMPKLAKIMV